MALTPFLTGLPGDPILKLGRVQAFPPIPSRIRLLSAVCSLDVLPNCDPPGRFQAMPFFRSCIYLGCFSTLLIAGAPHPAAAADKESKSKKVQPLKFGEIELKGGYPEGAGASGLFGANTETLSDLIGRFDKAARDEKLDGIVLKFN